MTRIRFSLTALVLSLALLAAPVAAAPLEGSPMSFTSILASFWERVMAPLASVWEKDGDLLSDPEADGATTSAAPADGDTAERRLHIDPNG